MSAVILSWPEQHVALLRLDRPEHRNALDLDTRRLLADHFRQLAEDDRCRVAVVTGGHDVFAAGADLRMLARASPSEVESLGLAGLWKPIADFPKPVVAAVNGLALGGGFELALHSDVIIAGRTAQFGLPEPRVGIMPGAGGTQRLARAVGKFAAMHLLLSAKPVPAERAHALGIVAEVVDNAETIPRATAFAASVAKLPPLAMRGIKRSVRDGADLPLGEGLALEQQNFLALFDTADQKEGMTAFLEKRRPVFRGA